MTGSRRIIRCVRVAPTVLVLLLAAQSSFAQSSVTIAGSFQSELGCPGDWQPWCTDTHLVFDAEDDVWQGTFTIPAGTYAYKAALDDSWDENYGQGGVLGGSNIPLSLGTQTSVKFYYDHKTHWVTDNVNSEIVVAVGDFQSELECAGDWQPWCLRSWLQDPDGDGTFTFTTSALPAGEYQMKAAHDESWNENYGEDGVLYGNNIPFTVPSNCIEMLFSYDISTHVLTVRPAPLDGDCTFNGKLDCWDLILISDGSASPICDMNSDGVVNTNDVLPWLGHSGSIHNWCGNPHARSDLNLDGLVNFTDLRIVEANLGMLGASFCDGDIDGNGEVNFADFLVVSTDQGFESCTPLSLDLTALLEGPYASSTPGTMKTDLNASGYLESSALRHPYTGSPWAYLANDNVAPGYFASHPTVVDWIYVELLSGDPDNPPLCTESASVAHLLSDGSVVTPIDGLTSLRVVPATTGNLHVGLYHRNHLPILSADPVTFDPPTTTSGTVAFATSMSSAFGTNPMKQVDTSPSRFALWAGNGEPDTLVDNADGGIYLVHTAAGLPGYLPGDYNMDGKANGLDFNLYLANSARGASSGLP